MSTSRGAEITANLMSMKARDLLATLPCPSYVLLPKVTAGEPQGDLRVLGKSLGETQQRGKSDHAPESSTSQPPNTRFRVPPLASCPFKLGDFPGVHLWE